MFCTSYAGRWGVWLNYEVPFCYFPFYISVYEILGGMIFMSIIPNYSTSFY